MNASGKKSEKNLKEKQLQVQVNNQDRKLKRETVFERKQGSMNDPRVIFRMNTKPV